MKNTTKKKRLLQELPDMMRGSLSLTSRSCGKANCKRCREGGKHPIYLFNFSVKGEKHVISIPQRHHEKVEELIKNWHHYKVLIEELTELNVKLIREGEPDI